MLAILFAHFSTMIFELVSHLGFFVTGMVLSIVVGAVVIVAGSFFGVAL